MKRIALLIRQPGKDGFTTRHELFDYQTDPHEIRNHADDQPQVVAELLEQVRRTPDPQPDESESRKSKPKSR